jgi:hypothetical protein
MYRKELVCRVYKTIGFMIETALCAPMDRYPVTQRADADACMKSVALLV